MKCMKLDLGKIGMDLKNRTKMEVSDLQIVRDLIDKFELQKRISQLHNLAFIAIVFFIL